MKKSTRKDAVARRIALALSICCATTYSSAAEVQSTAKRESFRHLLSSGWKNQAATPSTELPQTDEQPSTVSRSVTANTGSTVDPRPDQDFKGLLAPSLSQPATDLGNASSEFESAGQSLADLLRDEASTTGHLDARSPLMAFTDADARDASELAAIDSGSTLQISAADATESDVVLDSLADYLRANQDVTNLPRETTSASVAASNAETSKPTKFVAPARRPLPSDQPAPTCGEVDRQIVQTAPSMREPAAISAVREGAVKVEASRRVLSPQTSTRQQHPTLPGVAVPSLATVPPRVVRVPSDPPNLPTSQIEQSARGAATAEFAMPAKALSGKVRVDADSFASRPQEPAKPSPDSNSISSEMSPAISGQYQVARVGQEGAEPDQSVQAPKLAPSPLVDSIRKPITKELSAPETTSLGSVEGQYAILPIPSLESVDSLMSPTAISASTPSVTLHTARLLELAQHSIMKSEQSLQRGATHSARKYAIEAVRMVVSMRDAQDKGNVHGQQLKCAFDAIRESKDFCGEFGSIDTSALRRMVDVHETTVLKAEDLSKLSPLEATEAYLEYAKEQFVLATGGIREGSQALILLGQIEFQIANRVDTHATSVAVTIQRAAVEADPHYSVGYRILGTTLLNLGLIEEAANCLITSLQIQPTRLGYESLLDVSRRLGDIDTARVCIRALEDPRMEEGGVVRSLSPQEFASTYRPDPRVVDRSGTESKAAEPKAQTQPVARVGFGSLFSFGRK